jgi:hypothetical protein
MVADKRSFRRVLGEWLLGGGALLALVTGVVNFMNTASDRQDARHKAACEQAHAAILDDGLNQALSQIEQNAYLQRELKVAANCDKDVGQ